MGKTLQKAEHIRLSYVLTLDLCITVHCKIEDHTVYPLQ